MGQGLRNKVCSINRRIKSRLLNQCLVRRKEGYVNDSLNTFYLRQYERNVNDLFNNALNTFYFRLHDVIHMVKGPIT